MIEVTTLMALDSRTLFLCSSVSPTILETGEKALSQHALFIYSTFNPPKGPDDDLLCLGVTGFSQDPEQDLDHVLGVQ